MAISPEKSFWTTERVGEMLRLDKQGLSASQIANAIGAQSRNAVLAKLHRLGARDPDRQRMRRGKTKSSAPKIVKPASIADGCRILHFPIAPVEYRITGPLAGSRNLRIADDGFTGCRWPTKTGSDGEQRFCCAPITRGSYCEGHAAKGYKHPSDKDMAETKELIKIVRKHA